MTPLRAILSWLGMTILAIIVTTVVLLTVNRPLQAEQAPYQAYKISYGCLYVVASGPNGGVAAVVTPSVQGQCR